MKITNEQIDALLRQGQPTGTRPAQAGDGGAFAAAFAQQLGMGGAEAAGATTGPPPAVGAPQASMISQMLLAQPEEAVSGDDDVLQSAFAMASGTLDLWDSYRSALQGAGQGGSLREAYSLLEGIDGQVADLKAGAAGLQNRNAGLDSLINELEVMTATEKFKFNRGDYL